MKNKPENVVEYIGKVMAFVYVLGFGQVISILETWYWKLFWTFIACAGYFLILNISEDKK